MAIYTNDADLEGCWRFDNDLTDESANGYDLTDYNTVGYSSADKQQGTHSLSLVSANLEGAYIADASCPALDFSGNNWSLLVWINPDNAANRQNIVDKGGSSLDRGFYFRINGDDVAIYWATGAEAGAGYTTNNNPFNDDAWHHVVLTYDGSTIRCYVDGSETSSDDFPVTQGTNCRETTSPFRIGIRNDDSDPWQGLLDEMAFFSRTLNSTDISDIYNNGIQDAAGGNAMPMAMNSYRRRRV